MRNSHVYMYLLFVQNKKTKPRKDTPETNESKQLKL